MIDPIQLWTVIFTLAAGTFFIRWSGLGLLGGRDLPPWVLRHLRYTAVAILPGLIAPFVLWPPATGGSPDAARLLAAMVVFTIGVWKRSVIVAVLAGFATLYGVQLLVG